MKPLFALVVVVLALPAQNPGRRPFAYGAFTKEEFAARRAKVYEAIGENVAVLVGAPAGSAFHRWRQHNEFFYLCGVEREGAVLLLDGRSKQTTLFLPSRRRRGPSMTDRTGIERVMPGAKFVEELKSAAKGCARVYLATWPGEGNAQARDVWPRRRSRSLPADRRPRRVKDFESGVLEIIGQVEVVPIESVMDPMRRVKSAAEVKAMREAARVGALGIRAAIKATRPGVLERELEGVVELTFLKSGAHRSAWTPIVASGPNITNFHYMENMRRMEAGDMVLIDAGPDLNQYCTDITRVWPVSGQYPKRWRELYDKLLLVHKATIAAVRPGVTVRELTRVLRSAADEQGIRRHVLGVSGHYTGLAPHDVGDRGAPFVPGVVFNVEPLLVVPGERLHIRFEDTVLCTEGEPEVLTPLDILPWDADKLLAIRDGK